MTLNRAPSARFPRRSARTLRINVGPVLYGTMSFRCPRSRVASKSTSVGYWAGTQIKSVQQQTMDRSHPGQGHWEAGPVKTDPLSGQVRTNQYGRPKLTNDKSKVNY